MLDTIKKDKLTAKIFATRDEMGKDAATDIATALRELLAKKSEVNVIFAAAPSQNDTLGYLIKEPGIDWTRVNAFHMDEYIGLPADHPAGFGNYLREHIFSHLPFASVNYIDCSAVDAEAECERYSALLKKYPTDIVVMGVGENGHIAFNDPPVADFTDPKLVKPVPLDEICRNQQVNDGCFEKIDDVPTHALTLTVPALFSAAHLFCSVPCATKAEAIREMLTTDKIDEHCPAAILRLHDSATLYCDAESSALVR